MKMAPWCWTCNTCHVCSIMSISRIFCFLIPIFKLPFIGHVLVAGYQRYVSLVLSYCILICMFLYLQVLALTLAQLMPQNNVTTSEQDKHLLTSLMFCLGEWCMKMPADCLLASCNGSCLLLTVFKVIRSNKTAASSSVCQSFLTVFFLAILFFILSFN